MKQKATVVSTNGKYATVKVDRASMCDGCHKSGCGDGCALYKMFGAKTSFEAEAVNSASACAGDLVYVETSDGRVNFNAFVVFLLPIIIAAGVYFALFFVNKESLRILFATLSFAVYFAILAIVEAAKKNRTPRLDVTSIIKHANE